MMQVGAAHRAALRWALWVTSVVFLFFILTTIPLALSLHIQPATYLTVPDPGECPLA